MSWDWCSARMSCRARRRTGCAGDLGEQAVDVDVRVAVLADNGVLATSRGCGRRSSSASSSSVTKTSVARPAGAVRGAWRPMSRRAAMSTPWNGSSRISRRAGFGHPAADHRPSAGCRPTASRMSSRSVRQTMPSSSICRARHRPFGAPRSTCRSARMRVEEGQAHVLVDVEVRDDAVVGAVLGDQEDALRDRLARSSAGA